jgi:hypothetical protein
MRYFVSVLVFIFIAPICIIAGLFSTCLFAGATGGNETLSMVLLIAGPVLGLLGSIALTVLIARGMKNSMQ